MKLPIHLGLKISVIITTAIIAVLAWLCFWLFGQDGLASGMTLQVFLAQLWQADSPVFWQASRILAVLAYVMLWLSVMTGLSISSQSSGFWFERGTALSWHKFFTWFGLSLALVHAGILLKDSYLAPSASQLLIPFSIQSANLPTNQWLWIGLGQLAWYLMLVIALGGLSNNQQVKKLWRYLHAFALLAYVAVVAHGVFSGTDSQQLWLKGGYVLTNLLLAVVVIFRILQLKLAKKGAAKTVSSKAISHV